MPLHLHRSRECDTPSRKSAQTACCGRDIHLLLANSVRLFFKLAKILCSMVAGRSVHQIEARAVLIAIALQLSAVISNGQTQHTGNGPFGCEIAGTHATSTQVSATATSGASTAGRYAISFKDGVKVDWQAEGYGAWRVDQGIYDTAQFSVMVVVGNNIIGNNDPNQIDNFGWPWPPFLEGSANGTIRCIGVQPGDIVRVYASAASGEMYYEHYAINFPKGSSLTWSYIAYKVGDQSITRELGNTSSVNKADLVADPVSVTSGVFYANHVDLHVNGPLPIEVRRTYSSRNAAQTSEFGYAWLSGNSSFLVPSADLSTIQAADSEGSVVLFRRQGTSTLWTPDVSDNPQLTNSAGGAANLFNSTIVQSSPSNYQWQMADGSVRNYVVQQFPITSNGDTYPRLLPYLTTWVDSCGNALTYTYGNLSAGNDYGRINLIQSSNGSSVSFVYDSEARITRAVASDGRTVNYSYENGELISVQLPDGSITGYLYGGVDSDGFSTHHITQETKPDGRILQNVYDAQGRVVEQWSTVDQIDPTKLVKTATFDYNVAGQTTMTDAYGNPTIYQYASGGLMTKITDPLNQTVTQTWYTSTNTATGAYLNSLESVTDKRGLVTTYKYDAQGNITETKLSGNLTGDTATTQTSTTTALYNTRNLPTTVTDASGITTTFAYTDLNYPYLPTQIATAKGGTALRTDKLEYTAQGSSPTISKGLLQRKTVALGTADQVITEYVYNAAGFMTQQTAYTGTTDANVVTTFSYNSRGELETTTDADGRSTTYTYDAMSRPLTKVVKNENAQVLGTWTMTYTANGELSQTTGARTSPADIVERAYDSGGRLMEEVAYLSQAKPDGSGVITTTSIAITSYGHDYSGNRIHHGPGCRINFRRQGNTVVILPRGGDKTSQAKDQDSETTAR